MLAIIEEIPNEDERRIITQWYEQFYKIMRRKAYELIHDYDLANDMVNEAFIKIIKNFDKIKQLNCHARAFYFVSTIRSVSIDYLRHQDKESQYVTQFYGDGDQLQNYLSMRGELDAYEKVEIYADLEKHLAELPERDRYLLIYRYVWHMSAKEIARLLHIREGNVNSYIKRARARLIKMVDKEV